uniref:Transmembrane protein n=1 Tax=Medicago truncatula TaxID=3880 RepID=Q2HTC0_MEDTR|nr:hypothetical protein MtrDRAFT_AC150443g19v2 [Medicago truncatula]
MQSSQLQTFEHPLSFGTYALQALNPFAKPLIHSSFSPQKTLPQPATIPCLEASSVFSRIKHMFGGIHLLSLITVMCLVLTTTY